MKDLIAKLKMDANCALGAIWMHIDAREKRIAELEAQIAAKSGPAVGTEWKSLNDVQWMNIVNHDHAYFGWDKEDAVHHAVKATEAKLRELNSTALQAPVREVPGWQPIEAAPKDGTRIFIGRAGYERTFVAYWHERWQHWAYGSDAMSFCAAPTHWMPLPPAPNPEQAK